MAKEKYYGCIIFEDVFERLDKFLNDEQLGKVMRSALNYGFNGVLPEAFENPIEEYAFSELKSAFDRNKESYDEQSINGKIGSAIKYAKTLDELHERLESIDGLANFEKAEAVKKWKEKHKES